MRSNKLLQNITTYTRVDHTLLFKMTYIVATKTSIQYTGTQLLYDQSKVIKPWEMQETNKNLLISADGELTNIREALIDREYTRLSKDAFPVHVD